MQMSEISITWRMASCPGFKYLLNAKGPKLWNPIHQDNLALQQSQLILSSQRLSNHEARDITLSQTISDDQVQPLPLQ